MREFLLFIGNLKQFFLQVGEMTDIPTYKEEKQTVVDENEVNQAFGPANDIFGSLRDAGDWLVDFFTNIITQIFGNFM